MNQYLKINWRLPALVVLGLALRIGLAVVLGLDKPPAFGTDQYEYDNYAWNVAQGRGYRGISPDVADTDHLTAYRPPGTSLTWAALYQVFGHRFGAVRLAHCLAGALSIVLVYHIGRRCFGETVGMLAAALLTVYPTALLYSTELLSEPLATFWLLAFILACLWFAERPTWSRGALAGLLLGWCLLSRPNYVLMVPLTIFWAFWQFRGQVRALAMSLAIPAVALLALVPWTVRNYEVFGAFIPFSTMGGSVLLQGNNRVVATDPLYYGYSVWDTEIPEYRKALQSVNDEVGRDRLAKQFAIQWLKENPDRWPYLLQAKFRRAWTPFLQPHSPRLNRIGMLVSWGPVLVLLALSFVPTLIILLRSRHPGWIVHLGILHYGILTLIFFGNSRYRAPVEPLCLILAAQWLVFCTARWIAPGDCDGGPVLAHATVPDTVGAALQATPADAQLPDDLSPARIDQGLRS
jgi:4-amino-4-deoxy-L-arabinose transferase-like glycosyltransferase